jgi:hypothetical protein
MPDYTALNKAIGPVYLLEDAARALRVTVHELRAMIDRSEVVALPTQPGELLIPLRSLAQATTPAKPLPGLAEVVAALPPRLSTSDISVWLTTSVEGRPSHADRLRAGDIDGVVASALAFAGARASERPTS